MFISFMSSQPSLMLNIVSTVFLIRVNKQLLNQYECSFVSLTAVNALGSLIGMVGAHQIGLFKIKQSSLVKTLPLSISFCLCSLMASYSLKLNTTGTYQALISIMSPVILIISFIIYKQEYKLKIFHFMVIFLLIIFFIFVYLISTKGQPGPCA